MNNRLAIVPARGGSKRLPGKNMMELGGKPLIFHTLDVVSPYFDCVIFTTDDSAMLKSVEDSYENSNIAVRRRPDELCTDTSKVIDTVMHYVNTDEFAMHNQIWLCLPTCPLREGRDVENAQALLDSDIDSVLTVTDYEFPPSLGLLEGAEGLITGYDYRHPFASGNSRSQDQPRVLRPNGALYGSWKESLISLGNFYKGKVRGSYMSRERSVDIDTKFDFMLAETLLKQGDGV